jgi:hypothetical protein
VDGAGRGLTDERAALAALLPAYELGDELGRGTWGVVLAARHRALGRMVAVKQLPRTFATDQDIRDRFVAEARVVASLDHPHIVPVHDFIDQDGICAIVMELLPGGTLWDRSCHVGVRADVACALVLGLCAALQHAHEHGVAHRDVKPENVLLTAAGAPKLTDFGIARLVGASAAARTATGVVLGTPAYLAPEQATGEPVGPATDVHGAGVVLFELLSGVLPYGEAADPVQQILRVAYDDPTSLRAVAPEVPAPLAAVTMHALAKSPGARPPSAEALGVSLARAAVAVFGSSWLEATGVPLVGAPAIVAAATGPKGSGMGWAPPLVRPRSLDLHGAVEVPHGSLAAAFRAAAEDAAADGPRHDGPRTEEVHAPGDPDPAAPPTGPGAPLVPSDGGRFDPTTTSQLARPERFRVGTGDDVERARRLAATAPPQGLAAAPRGTVPPPTLDDLPPLPYDHLLPVDDGADDPDTTHPVVPTPPSPAQERSAGA